MSVNEAIKNLLSLHDRVNARLDSVEKELRDNHAAWQRDRARYIRLEAQTQAVLSLLAEMLGRSGVSAEHVVACFRQRFLHFQDREFQETEKFSADLAASIDTRALNEIPTDKGPFAALFPAD